MSIVGSPHTRLADPFPGHARTRLLVRNVPSSGTICTTVFSNLSRCTTLVIVADHTLPSGPLLTTSQFKRMIETIV